MFENFEQMFNFYMRRRIFTQHDFELIKQGVVSDNDSFWEKIVGPKHFQGRLNYGDIIRISAILG